MNNRENIFITGITGVVGGRLLFEILEKTDAFVYTLLRANTYEHAKRRMSESIDIYDMDGSIGKTLGERVIPIIGDISEPMMGIEQNSYYDLCAYITLAIHVAGNVNMVAPYKTLKKTNVDGTKRVIEFCMNGDIPLVHTSSYSVVGDKIFEKGFVFYENQLDIGQSFDRMNYQRTKFEAELAVHQASAKGLKAIVARLGDVFGDSCTGAYPLTTTTVTGLYYDFLKSVIKTGLSVFRIGYFDITPVDYVAEAILALSLAPEHYGKTFHVVNPEHKKIYEIVNLIVEYGYRIRMLPLEDFVELFESKRVLVENSPYNSPFISYILYLADIMKYKHQSALYDTSNTETFLKKKHIACPKPDINLFSTYLTYCIENNFLPHPADQGKLAIIKERE